MKGNILLLERQYNASTPRHDITVTGTGPLEIRAEGFALGTSEDRSPLTDRTTNQEHNSAQQSQGNTARNTNSGDKMGTRGAVTLQDGTDTTIRLDLETEDGKKQEIFIDDKGDCLIIIIFIIFFMNDFSFI